MYKHMRNLNSKFIVTSTSCSSIWFVQLNSEKCKRKKKIWWKGASEFSKAIRKSEDIIDNLLTAGISFDMYCSNSLEYFVKSAYIVKRIIWVMEKKSRLDAYHDTHRPWTHSHPYWTIALEQNVSLWVTHPDFPEH